MAEPKEPKGKKVSEGMYKCKDASGAENFYHSSTINALIGKKSQLKVLDGPIKNYAPKHSK